MRKIILVLSLLNITIACSLNSKKNSYNIDIEKVKSQTIELHDKLMLDMGKLLKVKKTLEVMAKDSSDAAQLSNTLNAINQLYSADKAMWDWMHNFDIAYRVEQDSVTLLYFDSQLRMIQEVDSLFETSIAEGQKIVSKRMD